MKSKHVIPLVMLAKELAHRSPNRLKHAAIVLDNKWRVISHGVNHGYVHAEVDAIRKIPESKRRNLIVIGVRLSQAGHHIATAKPCRACQKALYKSGVKKVFYTTKDRNIVEAKLKKCPKNVSFISMVLPKREFALT